MMEQKFPENFGRLRDGEEFLRAKSIEAINASEDLLAHATLIERAMHLIDYFCRQHTAQDHDELSVQLLGIRMFNGAASALKLLLSGYYQSSALQQRDLLETIFLLDYFKTDRTLITGWRGSDERARQRNFGPAVVRKALDERDGFTERKREKAYKLLCELAGHPTYAGFRMLAPQPGGNAHCGPFFEFTAFKAVYEELAKHLVQAPSVFMQFFPGGTMAGHQTKISFMEVQGRWAEKFYNRPFDQSEIDELRALLAAIQPTGDTAVRLSGKRVVLIAAGVKVLSGLKGRQHNGRGEDLPASWPQILAGALFWRAHRFPSIASCHFVAR